MVVCATVGDNKQLLHVGEGARGCPQANTYANGNKSKTVNAPLDKRSRKDMQRKKKLSPHTKYTERKQLWKDTDRKERQNSYKETKKVPQSWMEPRQKKEQMYKTPKKKSQIHI